MAIVTRQTKAGPVYWVVTRGHAERVGLDKREAERVNARRKKESKAGTFSPVQTGAVTVRAYLAKWLAARTNRSADVERTMIRIHVLSRDWISDMRMEDVRPRHFKQLVLELQATGAHKPKYVANIFGAVRAAFRAAVLDEIIPHDVCLLPPGLVSKKTTPKIPYTRDEAGILLASAERGRRVWLALALYTGMRAGEVCGRRWRDWDEGSAPLACLTVGTQYDGQPLKTDNPRRAPVHPELAAILTEWRSTGFEVVYLRKPRPDDLIVPAYPNTSKSLTRSGAYKAIAADCKKAGVTCRGMHATRHTFVSAVQRDGAEQKVVERITHNASGSMIDHYTHREWDELCAAVLCLRPYGQKLDSTLYRENLEGKNKMIEGSDSRTRTPDRRAESAESKESSHPTHPNNTAKTGIKRGLGAELDAGKEHSEDDFRAAVGEHLERDLRGVRT